MLEQLFGENLIRDAIYKLPVEHTYLGDSIFLQLHKSYHFHFKNVSEAVIQLFNQKRLEYYYLLLRVYCEMLP